MKVGEFEYIDGTLSGPARYMREQGDAKLDAIMAGTDLGFNAMVAARPDIEPVSMVLTALQTDYAGWLGLQQTLAFLKGGQS